ncbi:uncharacterized protein CLUP02_11013 [Colletotrichum lupini]|uniref:Uncharacterized protein n=1 Tax=Colletotrichum lupini TaxID=145971 RepID=A0A9Q8SY17_9PEZI|nr:uncharacterized protein CLUP02_11013 [Colletotrichum lupini]UQC85515.1 hypothetical protein CLUP02_11013 [Colletotrichum lupini]
MRDGLAQGSNFHILVIAIITVLYAALLIALVLFLNLQLVNMSLAGMDRADNDSAVQALVVLRNVPINGLDVGPGRIVFVTVGELVEGLT